VKHSWIWALAVGGVACGGKPPQPPPQPTPDTTQTPKVPPAPTEPVAPPPARLHAPVSLAFVGDINLGTLSERDALPPDSGRGLLNGAKQSLTGDLVIGNFEGVVGDSGITYKCDTKGRSIGFQAVRDSLARPEPPPPHRRRKLARRGRATGPGCYAFLTPGALAPRLAEAGFTHLNLANNHSNDFGPSGRASTDSAFQSLGITLYGPLGRIAVDTVRRGDSLTVVGLIGFATYPFAYDLLDVDRSVAVVDSLRPLVDLLLVTFHGGAEGASALHVAQAAESLGHEQRGDLRRWAHAVIDAGADAVVGHGPHVLRGVEFYRGSPVAYSLGNFLTYGAFNLKGPLGITGVLQLHYGPDHRLQRARLVPMRQSSVGGPRPDPRKIALALVRRLSAEDFGESAARVADNGELHPP
jgi:hypothetical protein